MDTTTLTTTQKTALRKVKAAHYDTAHRLGANPSALAALARRGLVERKWGEGSLRGDGRWSYRLSGRGVVALSKIARAEARPLPKMPADLNTHPINDSAHAAPSMAYRARLYVGTGEDAELMATRTGDLTADVLTGVCNRWAIMYGLSTVTQDEAAGWLNHLRHVGELSIDVTSTMTITLN